MVVIIPPQAIHMQGHTSGLRKALQAVRDHLGAEVADLFAPQSQVDNAVGPVREIDYRPAEGLVERGVGVSEAREARGRAEGAGEGVAQRDADVFGGVVVVDCAAGGNKS